MGFSARGLGHPKGFHTFGKSSGTSLSVLLQTGFDTPAASYTRPCPSLPAETVSPVLAVPGALPLTPLHTFHRGFQNSYPCAGSARTPLCYDPHGLGRSGLTNRKRVDWRAWASHCCCICDSLGRTTDVSCTDVVSRTPLEFEGTE